MASEKVRKAGGRAFPCPPVWSDKSGGFVWGEQEGMTLRDFMAAAALTGLLSGLPAAAMKQGGEIPGQSLTYAAAAYVLADAMLTVRGKR